MFGYEIGKSTGGGSYGGVGTGGLSGGVAGLTYGDDTVKDLVGGSGGGHAIRGSGNAGGGGGAISFHVGGIFKLEANATISANGGAGSSHNDGSGAGGSGGAIRIEANSILNFGSIHAKGGDARGVTSLAGAGGGGRIALFAPGTIIEGDTNASGGRNLSIVHTDYMTNDLVAHWKLDDNSSSSIAFNSQGNPSLNGVISGSPERRAGKKGGAFYFDGNDDKIIVPYNSALAVDQYTVAMWYFPERNDEWWTGLFGRGGGATGRIYSISQGASSHGTRPFFHHRFGEGTNWNEGVTDFYLSQWSKWYHIVFTNSGLSGKYARTYINGTFATGSQRYERRVLNELMIDYSTDLRIGASPDHGNGGYFLGMIDDIRFYKRGFGSEDVFHLYQGDPGVSDYKVPREGSKYGVAGSVTKVTTPTLPSISTPALSYQEEIINLDLGEVSTLSYNLNGLPPGLTNNKSFEPDSIPGLFAWYDADAEAILNLHPDKSYDRNVSVATDHLLVYLPFDESNGSIAYDYSGNGNHGKLIDQAQWSPGKVKGSVSFDGMNDGLVFEKVAYFDQPDSFTISFWFKRNSEVEGIPTNHAIDNLMLAQSSADFNENIEIGTEGSEVEIYLDSGSGGEDNRYVTNGANVSNGTWHHLTITYGNGLKIFVDGVERLSQTPYSGPLDSSEDSPLSLGMGRIFSDQWGDFNGSIDDFRIYSTEINATQVSSLYNSGSGDFGGQASTYFSSNRISVWRDKSVNSRDAVSSYEESPVLSYDPDTGKRMVKLDYGKSMRIPDASSMPMTIYLVGYETGFSFPDRELFTFEGWRMIQNGQWGLSRWNDDNPQLNSTVNSGVSSLLGWTISRYEYEVRANGEIVANNVSGNWRPEVAFDRINGDTQWMAGEILFYPRVLELEEKQKIEGFLAHKWNLQSRLPFEHPYKNHTPLDKPGLILSGIPQKAGNYLVSVDASNQHGQVSSTFNLQVLAKPPRVQTAEPTQVGSTSARLQANVIDLGGTDGNLSFLWGTNPDLTGSTETVLQIIPDIGMASSLLSGLSPSSTYYFRAKVANSTGISNGDAISSIPAHIWELNDTGSLANDRIGTLNGTIVGASVVSDPTKGRVLQFDGNDDYVNLGDVDKMDEIDRFTISLWFKRTSDNSVQPSNHGIDNVLIAQSSAGSNDNFEIGTQGSEIEIYLDTGSAATDQTVRIEAGITNGVWYHLALVYGSEMVVYLNGSKVNTWTQYNGRLESSGTSPLSIGIARPNNQKWGEFSGEIHRVQLFYEQLNSSEVRLLAGSGAIKSFTTGSLTVPPVVETRPATGISDSNATISYELVSYDGAQPEIILYWGTFDHGENAGLWDNSKSLGTQPAGIGTIQIGGYQAGQTVFYQVQAKGTAFSDWADESGKLRMVALPSVTALTPTNQSKKSAVLQGEVSGNGGESSTVTLNKPLVSRDLIAHLRFDEGQGTEAYDSTGFSPVAQVFGGATWTDGKGGQFGTALKFDGSNLAYVKAGGFRIEGATSFSGWVYKENLGNWQRMFDFGNGPDNHNLLVANRWTTNQAEWAIRRGANNRGLVVQDFWKLNEWQHVVASVDDFGLMKLYSNGQLKGSYLGHLPQGLIRNNHYIGRSNWGEANFLGMMDDNVLRFD